MSLGSVILLLIIAVILIVCVNNMTRGMQIVDKNGKIAIVGATMIAIVYIIMNHSWR